MLDKAILRNRFERVTMVALVIFIFVYFASLMAGVFSSNFYTSIIDGLMIAFCAWFAFMIVGIFLIFICPKDESDVKDINSKVENKNE